MKRSKPRSPCDPKAVEEFDYSGLSPEFAKLSKPAQRALVNRGILTPRQLSRLTKDEVLGLHGVGPSAVPVLQGVLKKYGLGFRSR